MPEPGPIAYHLATAAAWNHAQGDAPFAPASLVDEGFVHLTGRPSDLVDVANALYREVQGPHVVLTVALDQLTSPWRYDGDERFPHVYGPLDRAAIIQVRPMARAGDGTFLGVAPPGPGETGPVEVVDGGRRPAG